MNIAALALFATPANHAVVVRTFELTPCEAWTVLLLVDGLSIREVAQFMGWTDGTARTYEKRALWKCDVHRQAQLVRVVLLTLLADKIAA